MSPCERTAHLIALRQMELQLRRAAAAARQEALLDLLSGLYDRLNAVTFESAYLRRPDLQVVLDAGAGLSADTPLEGLESWIESATVAQRRSEAYLNEAKRSERRHLARRLIRERMSVGSAEIGKQVVVEQGERASSRERNGHPSQLEKEESINRQAAIDALVEMFPVESSSREQARINSILERLAGASTIEFPSLLVAAKAEIQSVVRSVAQRRERHRRAGELLRGLDGLPGLEVDAARSRLQRVLDGRTELLQVDVDFAHRARSAGVKEIERRYMATQLHQAFRETGVMVGSEFVSEVLNRDEAYLASRFSADHAVAVRLREGLVDLRVVRGAGHPDPSGTIEPKSNSARMSITLGPNLEGGRSTLRWSITILPEPFRSILSPMPVESCGAAITEKKGPATELRDHERDSRPSNLAGLVTRDRCPTSGPSPVCPLR